MKRKATIGSLVGLLLLAFMVSFSAGADPFEIESPEYVIVLPWYDATGTWRLKENLGWTDCEVRSPVDWEGDIQIKQFGNSFYTDILFVDPLVGKGSIVGNRYQFHYGINAGAIAYTKTFIFTLDSYSSGHGYYTETIMDDESYYCNVTKKMNLIRQSECTATDNRMCLQNGRFSVRVSWEDEHGNTGDGHAIPSTDDSGLFWFFSQNNMELLIKVLDGCGINNRYWVFFAATTDQKFTVRVTDLSTDDQVEYTNPLKHAADAVTDTGAFATCP